MPGKGAAAMGGEPRAELDRVLDRSRPLLPATPVPEVLDANGDVIQLGSRAILSALHAFSSVCAKGPNERKTMPDHVIRSTAAYGIYGTYVLNEVEVGPKKTALVGVSVTDPGSERDIDVREWQSAPGRLVPDSPAGRDARCAEVMRMPESQLSAQDLMAAVRCVMSDMLGD
jgi:hypothetical protein